MSYKIVHVDLTSWSQLPSSLISFPLRKSSICNEISYSKVSGQHLPGLLVPACSSPLSEQAHWNGLTSIYFISNGAGGPSSSLH